MLYSRFVAALIFSLTFPAATAFGICHNDGCCCDSWLATTPQLTADWCGERTCLAESGVTLDCDYTQFYFGNTAGGVREAFAYSGHGDYLVNVDGGKLGVQEGLFLKIRAEHRFGESLVDDVGSFFSPTIDSDLPVYDSEQMYVTNFLITQALSEEFVVFAGKMDTLDGDMNAFAHGRGKTQFSNLAFCFNPIVAATVPYSTLGAGFAFLKDLQPIAGFTVLNSQDTTGNTGFDSLFEDGVLLSAYIRIPTTFFEMPGHQLFAGTWNSQDYDSLGEAYIEYPNLVIPQTAGSWSLFWNCDQYLLVDSRNPLRGWGVFGRAGIADANTSPLSWFLSFGMGGSGPLESRQQDTFGVGWYYAGTSNQIGPFLETVVGPVGDGQGVEIFYNYQLTPSIHLTPDLQLIVPARDNIDPALVAGLRANMSF
jgi:porin